MAATTPKMGLKVWNLLTDSYDHAQLAENFAKIDQHRHTEGQGSQIPTGGIEDGAISGSKLGDEQVTSAKLSAAASESVGMNTALRTYRKVVTSEATYKNETTGYTIIDEASIYVPVNSRLVVSYQALQKATTANAKAQIFIDGAEVKQAAPGGAPTALPTPTLEPTAFYGILRTSIAEMVAVKGETADTTYVSASGLVSSNLNIFGLSAGTHTVSIQAKAGTSGKVEIKNRFLWARVDTFV